jgi:hypothetical protein
VYFWILLTVLPGVGKHDVEAEDIFRAYLGKFFFLVELFGR